MADSMAPRVGLAWEHVAKLNNTAHTKGAAGRKGLARGVRGVRRMEVADMATGLVTLVHWGAFCLVGGLRGGLELGLRFT